MGMDNNFFMFLRLICSNNRCEIGMYTDSKETGGRLKSKQAGNLTPCWDIWVLFLDQGFDGRYK